MFSLWPFLMWGCMLVFASFLVGCMDACLGAHVFMPSAMHVRLSVSPNACAHVGCMYSRPIPKEDDEDTSDDDDDRNKAKLSLLSVHGIGFDSACVHAWLCIVVDVHSC